MYNYLGKGEVYLPQPPYFLSRHLRGYLLFHALRRGTDVPLAVEAHPALPLCPLHLQWFVQPKWDNAHRGLGEFIGVLQYSHIQGFSDSCDMVSWDGNPLSGGLVDHLVTYIYMGYGAMKITLTCPMGKLEPFCAPNLSADRDQCSLSSLCEEYGLNLF